MTDKDEEGAFSRKWTVTAESVIFNTPVFTDSDTTRDEVEEKAVDRLIEGLETGEITPRLKSDITTRDEIHSQALHTYSQACERCRTYTQQEKREIVVDDSLMYVCPNCHDELRDICNMCNQDGDERDPGVDIKPTFGIESVTEWLCTDCQNEDTQ